MNRYIRLLKFLATFLVLFVVYLTHDRWVYESLLESLYISFEDFPPDFSEALKALPHDDKPLKAYDFSNYANHTSETTIPPIVHFIWFENLYETHTEISDIPSMGSHAPDLCQKFNPDFTINVWNATAARTLLEQQYEWFLETYDSYSHPIQRVDAIKYFVLHHYGGFYLDLDIACRTSLKPLQPFPAWAPKAMPLGVNNDALAFRKGHNAVEKMTERLRRRNKNLVFPYLTIFWSTGPQFTGDILKEYLEGYHSAGHKYYRGQSKWPSDPDEVYILPQEFYSEQYTFFGHSPGGTWHEQDVAVVLWFVAHPWVIPLVVATLVSGCMAFAYQRWKRKGRHGYLPVRSHEIDDSNQADVEKHRICRPGFGLYERIKQLRNWLGGEVSFGVSSDHQLGRFRSSIGRGEEHRE